MNHKQVYRLWRGADSTYKRGAVAGELVHPACSLPKPLCPMLYGACDFVHECCAHRESLTCLAVVDDSTGICLATEASHRIDSRQVVAVLERLIHTQGMPRYLCSDNGPEFIAKAINARLATRRIGTVPTEPVKPWQNGRIESLIAKFRDE